MMKNIYAVAFAKNLKKLRIQKGLTQIQLAEMINYSEKAVSKWERGTHIPPTEVVISIAEIFEIGLDDLFQYDVEPTYFLGIDGGATKTTFAIADNSGQIIKLIRKSSSNPFDIGFSESTKILDEGIREVTAGISKRKTSLFAGLSGGTAGGMKNKFLDFFSAYGFASIDCGSDTENIVAASLGKKNGAVIILGTGISSKIQINGKYSNLAGYGYLFDKGGSGYDIGCDGIRYACMAEDGMGNPTIIRDLILEKMSGEAIIESLTYFYSIGKSGIASFCPLVITAYKKDDEVARTIIEKNMKQVARIISATAKKLLARENVANIVLAGGLVKDIELLLPIIEKYLQSDENREKIKINIYFEDIVYGALLKAGMPKIDED